MFVWEKKIVCACVCGSAVLLCVWPVSCSVWVDPLAGTTTCIAMELSIPLNFEPAQTQIFPHKNLSNLLNCRQMCLTDWYVTLSQWDAPVLSKWCVHWDCAPDTDIYIRVNTASIDLSADSSVCFLLFFDGPISDRDLSSGQRHQNI